MQSLVSPSSYLARRSLLAAVLSIPLGLPTLAGAQAFPASPIRVIVPAPAGGTMDAVTRILGEKAGVILGKAIVIDNRGGAAGNIAGDAAARAAPDGYTLLMGYDVLATNPHIYKMSFDPAQDLEPLLLVGSFPIAVTIRIDLPVKDFAGFVAYAKAHPGEVTFGSPGVGSTHHLAAEMLSAAAGLKLTHVPYKGADGMTADLVGGRLDTGFFSIGSADKLMQGGKARIIAVTDSHRYPALPDIPAVAETYPGVLAVTWFGLFAPKGTPKARQMRIAEAFAQALKDPAVASRLSSIGVRVINGSGSELASLLKTDTDRRGNLVRKLNLQPQ